MDELVGSSMDNNHARLLRLLASGKSVSATTLMSQLGVPEPELVQIVETLQAQGVPLTYRQKGYALPWPIQLLDEAMIESFLPVFSAVELQVYWQLDSTNTWLRKHTHQFPDEMVVLAECQSSARGRQGHQWLSPPGLNIHLSYQKRFEGGFHALSGLSLVVGISVLRVLDAMGLTQAQIKWPNDIMVGDAKLAGILVELEGKPQGPATAIVGIGLNIQLPSALRKSIGRPVIDVARMRGGVAPNRNQVAALLIRQLKQDLDLFAQEGFVAFKDVFEQRDWLRDKPLRLYEPSQVVDGVGEGVDDKGGLRVFIDQELRTIHSAEVTVRRR